MTDPTLPGSEPTAPATIPASMIEGIVKTATATAVQQVVKELQSSNVLVDGSPEEVEEAVNRYVSPRTLQDLQHPDILGEVWQIQLDRTAPARGKRRPPNVEDVYANRLEWRGKPRFLRAAAEDPDLALFFRYLNAAAKDAATFEREDGEKVRVAPLVPKHKHSDRDADGKIVGWRIVNEELITSVTRLTWNFGRGDAREVVRGTTSEGTCFVLDLHAPARPKPTTAGKKLEPPYPDAFYKGPHPEFVQMGATEKLPGLTGRCIFVGSRRLWEADPEELYHAMMASQSQETVKEILAGRREPRFYKFDPYPESTAGPVEDPLEMPAV